MLSKNNKFLFMEGSQGHSAPTAFAQGNAHSLQTQLLLELLRKNMDALASQETKDVAPIKLNEACIKLEGAMEQLKTVSASLRTASNDRLHSMKIVCFFLQRLAGLKQILDFKQESDSSFDAMKYQMVSLARGVVSEKKRMYGINEEYLERIAQYKVERKEFVSAIRSILTLLQSIKGAIARPSPALAVPKDVLQSLSAQVPQSFAISSLECLERRVQRMKGITASIQKAVHAQRQSFDREAQRLKTQVSQLQILNADIERNEDRLQQENRQLCSELSLLKENADCERKMHSERARRYEEEIARLTLELEKSHEQATPPTSVTKKQRRSIADIVVAFTGLSRDTKAQADLGEAVKRLCGRVHLGADFTAEISHVVCPPGYQSVRTMAAALSSKWIVSTGWLSESAKAGRFLPEAPFGQFYASGPATLRSKSFYLTDHFIKQQSSHQMNAACCRLLIEPIGKGRVVDEKENADWILCGDEEGRRGRNWLRLGDFIKLIPGHD